MNNRAQSVAQAKGFRDGLNGLPNRNPYKVNACYRQYNHFYELGKQRREKAKEANKSR